MQIETVPMPTQGIMVESVAMPTRNKQQKPAKAKPKPANKKITNIRTAAKQFKEAYRDVYGQNPTLTYDGTWIRLKGEPQGMNLKRLQERTKQLLNRKG